MGDIGFDRITGQAAPGDQQFLQVVATTLKATRFWAFTALNGDATITTLTNEDGTSGLGYLSNGTAYQNVLYTGRFVGIKVMSGVVKLELC